MNNPYGFRTRYTSFRAFIRLDKGLEQHASASMVPLLMTTSKEAVANSFMSVTSTGTNDIPFLCLFRFS